MRFNIPAGVARVRYFSKCQDCRTLGTVCKYQNKKVCRECGCIQGGSQNGKTRNYM